MIEEKTDTEWEEYFKREERIENIKFYRVGQVFAVIDDHVIYRLCKVDGAEEVFLSPEYGHDALLFWGNRDGFRTTKVKDSNKITKEEFEIITNRQAHIFYPLSDEELAEEKRRIDELEEMYL